MTTDPGDLVLDPTCGGGTTAFAAEKTARRWITIDTSRVALALTRERLLSAAFEYYELKDETRGPRSGFTYKEVPHVTLGSITRGEDPPSETLFDQPKVDHSKVRVAGPFTVESLSRSSIAPFSPAGQEQSAAAEAADHAIVLLDALRTQGIPRHHGRPAEGISLTPLPGTGAPHAEGTYRDADGSERPFAVSLGPRHGSITPFQVDEALARAPGDRHLVFARVAATGQG